MTTPLPVLSWCQLPFFDVPFLHHLGGLEGETRCSATVGLVHAVVGRVAGQLAQGAYWAANGAATIFTAATFNAILVTEAFAGLAGGNAFEDGNY